MAPRATVYGTDVSPSGFSMTTEVRDEIRDGKRWPYLTVSVRDRDGRVAYRSGAYAAWFEIALCWDERDRLWIVSRDTGVDVVVEAPNGWERRRWMPGSAGRTMLDAASGEAVEAVGWSPPEPIAAIVAAGTARR